ncbi:MAG: hypothetical protein J0H68_09005 [Sphingobacteriia bacterium]|nr:hypothetical protein [Sphingobacteriia bacterium]
MRKPLLYIWLRGWGEIAHHKILPYVNILDTTYSKFFSVKFLICTNENDIILKDNNFLSLFKHKKFQIIYANMHLFSDAINNLANATPKNVPVLSISLGIELEMQALINAYGWIKVGAYAHGWQIKGLGNDGTEPGKGWYNTCVLLNAKFIKSIKLNPLPSWIDNGILGNIKVREKEIPIGGGEEILLMKDILLKDKNAYFILDTNMKLTNHEHIATEVNFEEKIERKVAVAAYYLSNQLKISKDMLWNSLIVIKNDGLWRGV